MATLTRPGSDEDWWLFPGFTSRPYNTIRINQIIINQTKSLIPTFFGTPCIESTNCDEEFKSDNKISISGCADQVSTNSNTKINHSGDIKIENVDTDSAIEQEHNIDCSHCDFQTKDILSFTNHIVEKHIWKNQNLQVVLN